MGLDCYVNVCPDADKPDLIEQIWYGRKENEIHGWMQRKSGIPAEDFNLADLPLTEALLTEFEIAMETGGLTPTNGFFFGGVGTPEEVYSAAQELLDATRAALAKGQQPYYTSWW